MPIDYGMFLQRDWFQIKYNELIPLPKLVKALNDDILFYFEGSGGHGIDQAYTKQDVLENIERDDKWADAKIKSYKIDFAHEHNGYGGYYKPQIIVQIITDNYVW